MQSRNQDAVKQSIRDCLQRIRGNRFDITAEIVKLIKECSEPVDAFIYFLENVNFVGSTQECDAKAYFSVQELSNIESNYSSLVDDLLNKLISKKYETKKFYEELWKSIFESEIIFETEQTKIYAVAKLWQDGRIPYFNIKDGVKMSNEEFKKIIEKNKGTFQKILFIISCKYEQKTELSSCLLDVLEQCDDYSEKVVMLAVINNLLEQKTISDLMERRDLK